MRERERGYSEVEPILIQTLKKINFEHLVCSVQLNRSYSAVERTFTIQGYLTIYLFPVSNIDICFEHSAILVVMMDEVEVP